MTPPHQLFTQAATVCAQLTALLQQEVAGISQHSTAEVEANLQQKKCLTLRLEQLLKELRSTREGWQANVALRNQAHMLRQQLATFQEVARHNGLQLQAAHQLRADVMLAIRHALEDATPRPRLYGAHGAMQQVASSTRVVAQEV